MKSKTFTLTAVITLLLAAMAGPSQLGAQDTVPPYSALYNFSGRAGQPTPLARSLGLGLQLYWQRLDPRLALGEARTRAAQLALTKATTVAQIPTAAGNLTTFDVPGAVGGTFPGGINSRGDITGSYFNASGGHGFLRASSGALTTFDIPGAVFGTFPVGINNGGVVTGEYCDASNCHGFVRRRDGAFDSFDPAPVSGSINPAGAVAGYFFATSPTVRSFVRDPIGTVTIYDAPNVCKTSNGTFGGSITPAGLVEGTWYDPNCADFHGFFRAQDGTFTSFDVPGAQDTGGGPINPAGTVVGDYFDASGGHGYLRAPNGAFSKFDIGAPNGPSPTAINPAAAVTGFYEDANGFHGFLFQPQ